MRRKYDLKRRATQQEATRQKIVEATVALHEEIGGVAATPTVIAERAGVGRVTFYRHFPDERSLLGACTSHYLAVHPPPDPSAWAEIADPENRLRAALNAICAFFGQTKGMLARAEQEMPTNPVLAELMAPVAALWSAMRDDLTLGWAGEDEPGLVLKAAIGHALAFSTWRSLVREQGLDDATAIDLLVDLVRCAATNARAGARKDESTPEPA